MSASAASTPPTTPASSVGVEDFTALKSGIIFAAGYNRFDYYRSMRYARPTADDSLLLAFPSTSTDTLGTSPSDSLSRLPLELVYSILEYLDLESVFRLRQTSRFLRQLITGDRMYRVIAAHGAGAFRALIQTKMARRITLKKLYSHMCMEKCSLCRKRFAGFYSLMYLRRTCYECVYTCDKLAIAIPHELARDCRQVLAEDMRRGDSSPPTGVDDMSLTHLPTFRVHAGVYSRPPKSLDKDVSVYPDRVPLLPKDGSDDTSDTESEEEPDLSRLRSPKTSNRYFHQLRAATCCGLPFYDASSRSVQYGVSCSGCWLDLEGALSRFTVGGDRITRSNRIYSDSEFVEHYLQCKSARQLYEASEKGTVVPKDKPAITIKAGTLEP